MQLSFRPIRRFPVRLLDGTKKWFFPFYGDDGRIVWRWPYRQPIVEEGGEPEPYVAQAVHFNNVHITFANDGAMATPDSPVGFLSIFLKRTTGRIADVFRNSQVFFNVSASGRPHIELADYLFNSYVFLDGQVGDFPASVWTHFLLAWDTNYALGNRRVGLYLADQKIDLVLNEDEIGEAFSVGYQDLLTIILSSDTGFLSGPTSAADFGLWVGQNIVEADGSISEVNRRKFVTSDGKPVDPVNWPANPVVKLVGNTETFPVNGGSGGATILVGSGSLTDADTSPSD